MNNMTEIIKSMGENPFKQHSYRYYSGNGEDNVRMVIAKCIDMLCKKEEAVKILIDNCKGFRGYINPDKEKVYRSYQNEYDKIVERKESLLDLDYSKPYIVVTVFGYDEPFIYECEINITDNVVAQVNFDPETYSLFTFSSDNVKGYEIKLHKKFGCIQLKDEYTFNGIGVLDDEENRVGFVKFDYRELMHVQYKNMTNYLRSFNDTIVITNNFKDIDLANKLLSSSLYTCKGCKSKYYIDEDTIKWYKDKNYHIPRHCPDCITNKKKKKS